MRSIPSLVLVGCFLALPAHAQSPDCRSMLGTYLTTKVDTSGVAKGVEGRTILSLARNGFAIMTDSAQGGIKGYQAFGMMQGFWHCEAASDSSINFRATLVDFSYPDENDPDAKIGRVEISGKVETKTGSLKGQTAVKIFPLFADPFSGKEPELVVTYDFKGQRILVTPPDQS